MQDVIIMSQDRAKFISIDDYIVSFPPKIREKLMELRRIIREEAPDATERISYQMPTIYLNGNLVHFAAFSKHIGFYPTPSAIEAFEGELGKYNHSKGAVQFQLDEPLPIDLVRRMVRFRVAENSSKGR